jgi:hypothetical protein
MTALRPIYICRAKYPSLGRREILHFPPCAGRTKGEQGTRFFDFAQNDKGMQEAVSRVWARDDKGGIGELDSSASLRMTKGDGNSIGIETNILFVRVLMLRLRSAAASRERTNRGTGRAGYYIGSKSRVYIHFVKYRKWLSVHFGLTPKVFRCDSNCGLRKPAPTIQIPLILSGFLYICFELLLYFTPA